MGDMREPVVGRERRARSRRTAGINGDRIPFRRHDKPEAIATQPVHVRVNYGNGGRRRDHVFDRAAAVAQDGQRTLAGKVVGGNSHPVCGDITLHEASS